MAARKGLQAKPGEAGSVGREGARERSEEWRKAVLSGADFATTTARWSSGQDGGLSRRKREFDSPTGHHFLGLDRF